MRSKLLVLIAVFSLAAGCSSVRSRSADGSAGESAAARVRSIPDPLEPVNRGFYHFNDKLYFWVLKPVSQGYAAVMPRIARRGVKNFFTNLAMPIRAVNCLLQADLEGTGTELGRFGVNTTVGVLGFGDVAGAWGIPLRKEDFGQTLGVYGLGPGLYITWPIFGPSSIRGTVGSVADAAIYPPTYVPGATAVERVNDTSLRLGDYEDLKEAALDPYIALRNAYHQRRRHLIEDHGE